MDMPSKGWIIFLRGQMTAAVESGEITIVLGSPEDSGLTELAMRNTRSRRELPKPPE